MESIEELKLMRANWFALSRSWGLDPREVALLLPQGGEDTPVPPADTERRMRLMLAIGYRLPSNGQADGLAAWPRTPLAEFGWMTPIDVMSSGPARMAALMRFVEWKYGR